MAPNNYCFAIDVRCMSFTEPDILPLKSCFVQYSYAFFGFIDKVKTSVVTVNEISQVVFEDGFCAFNFATTETHLRQTLKNIPLIMEIIEAGDPDLLLGTAKLCLYDIIDIVPNCDQKTILSHEVPVMNSGKQEIGTIQVIMCLQNWGEAKIGEIASLPQCNLNGIEADGSNDVETINVDALLTEAAYEIEMWKEQQLSAFRDDLQRKETEYFEILDKKLSEKTRQKEEEWKMKMKELAKLEERLESSINKVANKEKLLMCKETELGQRQITLKNKFEKLDSEISKAINELKANFEVKYGETKEKLKLSQEEKNKLHQKIYHLERKMKEKDETIKMLEEKLKISGGKPPANSVLRRPSSEADPKGSNKNNKGYNVFVRARTRSVDPEKQTQTDGKTVAEKRKETVKSGEKMSAREKKALILSEIEKEKAELLKSGIEPDDSIIKEIDLQLEKHGMKAQSKSTAARNGQRIGAKQTKSVLIAQIQKEKEELLKTGISSDDSIIKEIDAQLRKHKLHSK